MLVAAGAPVGDRGAPGGERGRPGPAVPHLRRAAARARHPGGAGAAHVLRHERPDALRQRAADAAQAARLADRAGDQRERHDDHGRDLLRRQRLPRRPGRGAGGGRAAVAADGHGRRLHGRPAGGGGRRARRRGERCRDARGARHRPQRVPDGLRRDAVEGRRRRDGRGGGDPHRDRQRARAGRARPRVGRRAHGHAVRAAARALLQLQALAQVREAHSRDADRRRRRGAGAARGRDEPAAGRDRRRARRVRRRRGRRGAHRRRRPDRQGDLQLLRERVAAGDGAEVRGGPRRCSRARSRRPCTGTTSC